VSITADLGTSNVTCYGDRCDNNEGVSLGQTFTDHDRSMSMNDDQSSLVTLGICTLCKIEYILQEEMHHDGLKSDELSPRNTKSHKR
jgi:hypothetical protein